MNHYTYPLKTELEVDNGLQASALRAIVEERRRQDGMHDNRGLSNDRWAVILGEEFGEVCRAIFEGDGENLIDELVQVAAVAVAWLEAL